jgi:HEAT repeat protein
MPGRSRSGRRLARAPRKRGAGRPKKSGAAAALVNEFRKVAESRGMDAGGGASSLKAGRRLRAWLERGSLPVRQSAAFAIAVVRDPSIVQQFIASLENASGREIARAALALGEAGYQSAVPYLLAAFGGGDERLSAALARALGMLGDRSAAPALMAALERGCAPAECAEALGRLDAAEAVSALTQALGHREAKVRAAAAYALGITRAGPDESEDERRGALRVLTADADASVRLCAAVALVERGDAGGLEAVKAALAS